MKDDEVGLGHGSPGLDALARVLGGHPLGVRHELVLAVAYIRVVLRVGIMPTNSMPEEPAPSGEQLNADELSAWRGLLRVHAQMTRALDEELVAAHSLPLTAYEVLLYLEDAPDGRLRMAELADAALLSRNGRARLVDRLEQGGLGRSDAADLADSVLLSRSGLTRVVERLVQRDLVRRESLPSQPSGST